MIVLDTDACSAFMDNDPKACQQILAMSRTQDVCLSSVSVFEIMSGIRNHEISPTMALRMERDFQFLLTKFRVINFDSSMAMQAGIYHASLVKTGAQIGPCDCMIAATAMLTNSPVLTGNVDHFNRILGLYVVALQTGRST